MIKKTKFTPGPWVAGRPDTQSVVNGCGSKYVYSGNSARPRAVAIATGEDIHNWDEVIANARLIAAAPELYDLSKRYAEFLEQDRNEKGIGSENYPDLFIIQDVLKKIEGEP